MSDLRRAIEEHIQRAIESGEFDHLPGKGKPLSLDDSPFVDPEWRLAWQLLKSNEYGLPWMELRKEIETEIEKARHGLRRTWRWRADQIDAGVAHQAVEAEWGRSVAAFREQVAAINRRIFDYNLQIPISRFHLSSLDVEAELTGLEET